jgi:hypothetical protein
MLKTGLVGGTGLLHSSHKNVEQSFTPALSIHFSTVLQKKRKKKKDNLHRNVTLQSYLQLPFYIILYVYKTTMRRRNLNRKSDFTNFRVPLLSYSAAHDVNIGEM